MRCKYLWRLSCACDCQAYFGQAYCFLSFYKCLWRLPSAHGLAKPAPKQGAQKIKWQLPASSTNDRVLNHSKLTNINLGGEVLNLSLGSSTDPITSTSSHTPTHTTVSRCPAVGKYEEKQDILLVGKSRKTDYLGGGLAAAGAGL